MRSLVSMFLILIGEDASGALQVEFFFLHTCWRIILMAFEGRIGETPWRDVGGCQEVPSRSLEGGGGKGVRTE